MTEEQKLLTWIREHERSTHELWLLQACLCAIFGPDDSVAKTATEEWKRRRLEDEAFMPPHL